MEKKLISHNFSIQLAAAAAAAAAALNKVVEGFLKNVGGESL